MSKIVSLQGGMAVGKTTLAKYLESKIENLVVSYEDTSKSIEIIKEKKLNKYVLEDYIEIQRIFILEEINRYNNLKKYENVIIDLGPEEIEFYAIYFPKSIGMDWNIELLLKDELEELRKCSIDGILFLDSSPEILKERKESDETRGRSFFEHYLDNLNDYKREWFLKNPKTQIINTDKLTCNEVGEKAIEYLNKI